MNIAVVDAGGNLIAHVRQDGAWIDISISKAAKSDALTCHDRAVGRPGLMAREQASPRMTLDNPYPRPSCPRPRHTQPS